MSSDVVVLPADQVWVLLLGAVVPLLTYQLNRSKWWKARTEWFKGVAQVVGTGLAGTLFALLVHKVSGFDNTVQYAFSAVVSGLYAHNYLWKPANVNVKFGARPAPTQTPKLEVEAGEPASRKHPDVPGVPREVA